MHNNGKWHGMMWNVLDNSSKWWCSCRLHLLTPPLCLSLSPSPPLLSLLYSLCSPLISISSILLIIIISSLSSSHSFSSFFLLNPSLLKPDSRRRKERTRAAVRGRKEGGEGEPPLAAVGGQWGSGIGSLPASAASPVSCLLFSSSLLRLLPHAPPLSFLLSLACLFHSPLPPLVYLSLICHHISSLHLLCLISIWWRGNKLCVLMILNNSLKQ